MQIDSKALLVVAAMAASTPSATAQTPQAAEDIVLQRGFSELVELPGSVENVAVGDPSIVDAVPMTANTFLLNAIEQGTTNILGLDPDGKLLYRARVHVRPVQIWPGYSMKVTYGAGLAHSYVCDREAGCPPRSAQPSVELPPVTNIFEGATPINNSATSGAGAVSASAPAAPASQ